MNRTATIYGDALYDLASSENIREEVFRELRETEEVFRQNPDYVRLLSPNGYSREERCRLVHEAFQGQVGQYLLNFLEILTGKGMIGHIGDCLSEYRKRYFEEEGIIDVRVTSAYELSGEQKKRLQAKIEKMTGKRAEIEIRVDESVLGGIRLNMDGEQYDGTVQNDLSRIRKILAETVL